jgi:hypothetical protein
MNGGLSLAVPAAASALVGCAVQATSGPTWANDRRPVAVVVGGAMESRRLGGPTLGARVGMAVDDGLVPKQGFVHMGYDARALPGRLVIEPHLDLGVGGPIAGGYSGLGSYLGVAANGRLKIYGVDDRETEFNIIGSRIDLVLEMRGGAWAPPEEAGSSRLIWESSVDLGVRFAITTDLTSGPPGKVQAPVTSTSNSEGND